MNWTFDQYMEALDTLSHANMYLSIQYADTMKLAEAKAPFGARAILINCENACLTEAERIFMGVVRP